METTKQFRKRNAILACLRGTTCHPSAEKLYQMLRQEHPDISLATVYRNLALFKSQGIIASMATSSPMCISFAADAARCWM